MKYFLVMVCALAFCLNASAQDKNFEFQDVCGDPTRESSLLMIFGGKVTKVLNGASIVVNDSKGKQRTVNLMAVSSGANLAAQNYLTETLLGKNVSIGVNTANFKDKRVWGTVWSGNINKVKEVNRLMIEQGITAYQDPAGYGFSNYTDCVYRQLEAKAKQEKRGIWAKQAATR